MPTQNHCVECSPDYVDGGVSRTLLIPVEPVPLDAPGALTGNVGVSLNGTVLAAPAPIQDILSNYTIAAFDDCGGHVNPVDGYHYHAASAGENMFIGCFHGETGSVEGDEGGGAPGGRPPGGQPPAGQSPAGG